MINSATGKLTNKVDIKKRISSIMERNNKNKAFFFGDNQISNASDNGFDRNNQNLHITTKDFRKLYSFYNNPDMKIPFHDGKKEFDEQLSLNTEVRMFMHYIKMMIKKLRSKDTSNPNIHLHPIGQNVIIITLGMSDHENKEYWNQEASDIMENKVKYVLEYLFDEVKQDVVKKNNGKINRYDFKASNKDSDLEIMFECNVISNTIFHSDDTFKYERFKAISNKRLERVKKGIESFNNFLNPANSRTYNYNIEDFDKITDSISKSLKRFIENYEFHFRKKNQENLEGNFKKIDKKSLKKIDDLKNQINDNIITKSVFESEKNLKKTFEEKIEKTFLDLKNRNQLLEKKIDTLINHIENNKAND
ncbi:hypothetical protein N9V10_03980 [Candidatus Marinimicrobia bacterium]|nr:hypothetical protein [Candidatus Neomarinimicrobiota bacterium]